MPAYIAPVEIGPASDDSWQDVDVSSHVPAEATGVILHIEGMTGNAYKFGARKNGSSDNRTTDLSAGATCWLAVGIDASRILELYIESDVDNIDVWLVGYFGNEATFLTNGVSKSLGSAGSWIDIDCSANAPNATGLLFEIIGYSSVYYCGFRKNGSTDNNPADVMLHNSFGAFVGCDASQVCEGKIESTNIDCYLLGYTTNGIVWNTNATDYSLGSTGSWIDLSALPAGATGGIFWAEGGGYSYQYGLRKNGSAEAIYDAAKNSAFAWVECDGSRLIEGKISSTGLDFWLYGYTTANVAPTAPTLLLCEGESDPTGVMDTTPEFSAILNDPDDGDTLTHVAIQVATDDGFSNLVWDSGWIDIVDVEEGNRCADVSYAGDAIVQAGQIFYWKIKAKDDDGAEGAWSSTATFAMAPKDVSVSDTGGGAESVAAKASVSVADVGQGADAVAWLRTLLLTETGEALAEVLSLVVQAAIADAGVGATSIAIRVPLTLTDAGTGEEAVDRVIYISVAELGQALDVITSITAGVSISDAGVGSETAQAIQALLTLADAGQGETAILVVATLPMLEDAGTGVESGEVEVHVSLVDLGSAADAVAVIAQVLLEESGAGTESAHAVQARIVLPDTGSGATVLSIVASMPTLTDAGVATDTIQCTVQVPLADTGTALDEALAIVGYILLAETGAGVESSSIYVSVSIPDSGQGVAVLSIAVAVNLSDAGAAADALLPILRPVLITDEGAGAESAHSVQGQLLIPDAGQAVTTIAVAAHRELTDVGGGEETLALVAQVSLADQGAAAEGILLVVNHLSVVDAGAGAEDHVLHVAVPVTDAGVAVDSPSVKVTLPTLSDLGVGTDAIAVRVHFTVTDAATGQEALSFHVNVPIADAGAAADSIAGILVRVNLADAGLAEELISHIRPVGIADEGVATDLLKLIQAWIDLADTGGNADEAISKAPWIPDVDITIVHYPPKDAPIEYHGRDATVEYDLNA